MSLPIVSKQKIEAEFKSLIGRCNFAKKFSNTDSPCMWHKIESEELALLSTTTLATSCLRRPFSLKLAMAITPPTLHFSFL